jgi:3-deoxy-manno-octulosonate cytidylyltransferase (CMP-KDO synthetase)
MKCISIIPARMSSGRFPGKPMEKISGIPMIGHCYLRSIMSKTVKNTHVACCDQVVYEYVKSIGGDPIMTRNDHEMCTDRVVEAFQIAENLHNTKYDIIINIQGDQPLVHPDMIDAVVAPLLEDTNLHSSSLMTAIKDNEAHDDPNRIKIVTDLNNNLLYMSREAIPSRKKIKNGQEIPRYVHVALTAFRRDFLIKFGTFKMSPLEEVEAIDNLRVIENGYNMRMVIVDYETETVDVPNDIIVVENIMKKDILFPIYSNYIQ